MNSMSSTNAAHIPQASVQTVVYGLGNVLIDWNPRYQTIHFHNALRLIKALKHYGVA